MSYLPLSSLVGMRGHFAVYNFRLVRLSLCVWLCYELPGDSTLAPWLDGENLPAFMCPHSQCADDDARSSILSASQRKSPYAAAPCSTRVCLTDCLCRCGIAILILTSEVRQIESGRLAQCCG